jgi:hypothetical protein
MPGAQSGGGSLAACGLILAVAGSVEAAEAWSLSAEPVAEIGSGAGMEIYRRDPVDGFPVLFGPRAYAAMIGAALAVGTAEAAQFQVYEPEGDLARIVRWPESFEPYAVRDGLMWGVYSDAVEVESVRAYRIGRG